MKKGRQKARWERRCRSVRHPRIEGIRNTSTARFGLTGLAASAKPDEAPETTIEGFWWGLSKRAFQTG
jgi:hypothetical protein